MNLQAEFPILSRLNYLNHASMSPLPARSRDALQAFAAECSTAGGNAYPGWFAQLKAARVQAGTLLGVPPDQVGLIHNTAHGILCVANSLPWRPGDNIVVGEHEFPANVHPWRALAERGVALRTVPERPDHRFTVDDFAAAIDARTRLVAVSLVQYSTGFRMPVERLAQLCRERGALLCVDGIQGCGAMPTRVADLGCDCFIAGAQKWLLALNGIGLMWLRPELIATLNQSMTGWIGRPRYWEYDNLDQPALPSAQRFEEGSQNLAGTLALGASLSLINEIGIDQIWSNIESLTARLVAGLESRGFTIQSPRGDGERSGIVAFSRPGLDPAEWAQKLERQGIVLTPRRGWLRASPHGYNQPEQIDALLESLTK